MIRAVPSNASDNVYCTLLAHGAVHGAMAGHTGFTVGPVNGTHAYIPFHVSSQFSSPQPLCCTLISWEPNIVQKHNFLLYNIVSANSRLFNKVCFCFLMCLFWHRGWLRSRTRSWLRSECGVGYCVQQTSRVSWTVNQTFLRMMIKVKKRKLNL